MVFFDAAHLLSLLWSLALLFSERTDALKFAAAKTMTALLEVFLFSLFNSVSLCIIIYRLQSAPAPVSEDRHWLLLARAGLQDCLTNKLGSEWRYDILSLAAALLR